MALAVWPSQLPYRPLRSPYDMGQRYAPGTSTEMEDGPDRMRSGSTSTWTQLAYQLRFTPEEYEVADAFVVTTLVKGTRRFWMPVGRPYAPDPWPMRMVYLEKAAWKAKPIGVVDMAASFNLNVLDW
ncbi:hypothetical protein G3T14_24240 [Methylobacterium sp. BTF04]|uniref:hypothetical protein n=1 Tax=Methylobacterium sp. BTF04 TaxID=2708300 RepID=UPI0013D572C9|nr:hypothetical protein [Methylobacterium sp. BTF04]NEU15137.1 hypothetical protein [Methylobacterium sp. BTF04]